MANIVVHFRGLVAGSYTPAAQHRFSLEIYESQLRYSLTEFYLLSWLPNWRFAR